MYLEEETDWYVSGSGTVLSRIDSLWNGVPELLIARTVSGIHPLTGQFQIQAQTQYLYDEYAFESGQIHTGVPNHNGNTSQYLRGNLTTVRSYRDASNVVETHFRYDNLGNLVKSIDPLGRVTSFDYADNFKDKPSHDSFAFPTLVTQDPGGLNHTVTTIYNYDTGLPAETIDLRNQTTKLFYDELNRLTRVEEPGGGIAKTLYDDSAPKITTEVKTDDQGVLWLRSETVFDKMGRQVRSTAFDPAGDVHVDTAYDGAGRVTGVSQPYRTGQTVYWTTTSYDPLGRPKSVTNPDSSQVTIDYEVSPSAPWRQTVTETDEAGNPRRSSFNGIGQMTKVEEPNPTLSTPLAIDYAYYVFGALGKVVQSSQTRTFTLDWLGRTLSEIHPESGTTSFTYDDAGQLLTRTDARGAGYQAGYTYDAIGRLKTITYADQTVSVRSWPSGGGERPGALSMTRRKSHGDASRKAIPHEGPSGGRLSKRR